MSDGSVKRAVVLTDGTVDAAECISGSGVDEVMLVVDYAVGSLDADDV